jgi:short-subunit dehydrogenase
LKAVVGDCFQGTTALVTGASSGMGEEFARQLAERGCHLVLVARSESKLQGLAAQLRRAHGLNVVVISADLSDPNQVEGLCHQLMEQGVRVDHLVNNAGFGSAGALLSRTVDSQQQMLQLNALAPLLLVQRLLPRMVERRAGGVINMASVAAFFPIPFMATYAASKAFLFSHTQAVAEELRGSGVRMMVLCPGPVSTGFQKRAGYELGPLERLAELTSEQVVKRALVSYQRGALICIPGLLNKIEAWLPRIIPYRWAGCVVGAIMRWMGRS